LRAGPLSPVPMTARQRKRRVLVADYAWPSLDIERRRLEAAGADVLDARDSDDPELVEMAAGVDGILVNWRNLPVEALEAAADCVVVSRYGVGVDNIPVDLATELGILVTNVPSFCEEEVADHAMALLLASARRIVPFAAQTADGDWNLDLAPGIPRLSEQTLGIVGFGRTARRLASRARAFGMRVLVFTPRLKEADLGEFAGQIEIADGLEHLLEGSDYVSLHAPATEETRRMIAERQLRAMRSDAVLINVSRGALIDQAALQRALSGGWIGGAALDVLEEEPPPSEAHGLIEMENTVVTPHVAFYSESAIRTVRESAAENVAVVLGGEVPVDIVNRDVLGSPTLRTRDTSR
jgi:D-3-phosphoglycerate dehydrogenase